MCCFDGKHTWDSVSLVKPCLLTTMATRSCCTLWTRHNICLKSNEQISITLPCESLTRSLSHPHTRTHYREAEKKHFESVLHWKCNFILALVSPHLLQKHTIGFLANFLRSQMENKSRFLPWNSFLSALQIHKNSFSNYHKSLSGSANGELMCSAQKLLLGKFCSNRCS